jgi:ATPase subunit of ABC transporter with duplicated ATPase domains
MSAHPFASNHAATPAGLAAVERGTDDPDQLAAHLAAIGDDWDIEERGRATLDQLGLTGVDFNRRVGDLSGGEAVLVGLAARFLREPAVLLLDEPTNNLDRSARRALRDAVAGYPGAVVVVSHDRELLALVDQVVEVRDGRATTYGGNYGCWSNGQPAPLAVNRHDLIESDDGGRLASWLKAVLARVSRRSR